MSMLATTRRPPLSSIEMNAATSHKRRSARLSHDEGAEDKGEEPLSKRARVGVNGAVEKEGGVGRKEAGRKEGGEEEKGATVAAVRKGRAKKDSNKDSAGFTFQRGGRRKAKEPEKPAEDPPAPRLPTPPPTDTHSSSSRQDSAAPANQPAQDEAQPKVVQKKNRRRFPTTPERTTAGRTVRRSNRLSDEHAAPAPQPSPHRPSHAKSHANAERSPNPEKARPVTVEKKRRNVEGAKEEKMGVTIPLAIEYTPIIRRNKEMRKTSAEGHRRSSSGMRGRRASSLMDEGRGNALPHAEVPAAEFFKHIAEDLTEPRRMRCLLGWCGQRALPAKPEPPKQSTAASTLEFQALQAARVIQTEIAQDLITKGVLSDWFSRDEQPQQPLVLRKKPNPRNIANAAKIEELERELERLKQEHAEWKSVMRSADANTNDDRQPPTTPSKTHSPQPTISDLPSSTTINPSLLDTPQRAILAQLQPSSSTTTNPATSTSTTDPTKPPPINPSTIQTRLRTISENIEFSIDSFAHAVHALSNTHKTAERVADKTLADAAEVLEERERERRVNSGGAAGGKEADVFGALRALGAVLNGSGNGGGAAGKRR